jgi:hypothetical protein
MKNKRRRFFMGRESYGIPTPPLPREGVKSVEKDYQFQIFRPMAHARKRMATTMGTHGL